MVIFHTNVFTNLSFLTMIINVFLFYFFLEAGLAANFARAATSLAAAWLAVWAAGLAGG